MSDQEYINKFRIVQETYRKEIGLLNDLKRNVRRTFELGDGRVTFDPLVEDNGYNAPYQHPNLEDVRLADIRTGIAQKNTLYIIGTITSATLIILAIMVGSK